MDYYEKINSLNCLAEIDNSDGYDIDVSGIYTDGVKFYFISASGCSCWEGEYDEEIFDSFNALKKSLIADDISDYAPSLKNVKYLITTAESLLTNKPSKTLDSDMSIIEWLSANSG